MKWTFCFLGFFMFVSCSVARLDEAASPKFRTRANHRSAPHHERRLTSFRQEEQRFREEEAAPVKKAPYREAEERNVRQEEKKPAVKSDMEDMEMVVKEIRQEQPKPAPEAGGEQPPQAGGKPPAPEMGGKPEQGMEGKPPTGEMGGKPEQGMEGKPPAPESGEKPAEGGEGEQPQQEGGEEPPQEGEEKPAEGEEQKPEEGEQKPQEEGEEKPQEEQSAKKCEPMSYCYKDSDCGDGTCNGGKTCECLGCPALWGCKSDKECGGFKGACDTEKGSCDCEKAAKGAGFESYFASLSTLCSKECQSADDCFGLRCIPGLCGCK